MTDTKENIYSVEVVSYMSGDKLAELTAAFLNANDLRCADYNEYGSGEQFARLLLAAYDLGAIRWEPSRGEGDSGYWRSYETDGVSGYWSRTLGMAATDLGFYAVEVREWLAGEPRDWDYLSEDFRDSEEWDLHYLWYHAQKNYEEDQNNE